MNPRRNVIRFDETNRFIKIFLFFFSLQAVDKDNSGEISVEEFKLFFKCLGMENDVSYCSVV